MKMLWILALVKVSLALHAQNTDAGLREFKKLEWILGSWNRTNNKPGRTSYENWEKVSAIEFRGIGVSFRGSDTVFVEKIKIILRNDTIYYVADVPENKKPVYFRMTEISPDSFTCENPNHDFPKQISYRRNEQSLTAQISGDGKVIDYFFSRAR